MKRKFGQRAPRATAKRRTAESMGAGASPRAFAPPSRTLSSSDMMALEPRLVFDGAAAPTAAFVLAETNHTEVSHGDSFDAAASVPADRPAVSESAIFDRLAAAFDAIAADANEALALAERSAPGETVESSEPGEPGPDLPSEPASDGATTSGGPGQPATGDQQPGSNGPAPTASRATTAPSVVDDSAPVAPQAPNPTVDASHAPAPAQSNAAAVARPVPTPPRESAPAGVFAADAWPGFERGATALLQANFDRISNALAANVRALSDTLQRATSPDAAEASAPTDRDARIAMQTGSTSVERNDAAQSASSVTTSLREYYASYVGELRDYAQSIEQHHRQWATAIREFAGAVTMAGPFVGLERPAATPFNLQDTGAIDADIAIAERAIVFVDARVSDLQTIVDAIPEQAEWIVVDPERDGFAQMAEVLRNATAAYDAIHIISHGDVGTLNFGASPVTDATLDSQAHLLAQISAALADDGDILLYGCDVGAGGGGQAFIDKLALLTGADVAASEDDTGAAARGGDWDLEKSSGVIEAAAIAAPSWAGLLAPTNTGAWSVSGTTATNTTAGITTTVTFTSDATSTFTQFGNPTNDTFNTINAFSDPSVQASPSLSFVYTWDTTPEAPGGDPTAAQASADTGTGTVTIAFSQPVTNPIINLDRLGGFAGYDPNTFVAGDEYAFSNGALWTLATPGATLTDLTAGNGLNHFAVTSTTIQRTPNEAMVYGQSGGESGFDSSRNTAAGSVQVNGTFTTLTFQLTGVGVEGGAADGIEMGFVFDPVPTANDDAFSMDENTTLNGNLFADNGSGIDSDPQADALTITSINGAAFTAGSPITLANGTLTITNAATGDFTFIPTADFTGAQTFTYTIADPAGGADTATATITVNAVNAVPTAVDDGTVTVVPGTPVNIDILGNDSDADGDTLTITHIIDPTAPGTTIALTVGSPVTLASGTTVELKPDGTLDVAQPAGADGAETFDYVISDGAGGAAQATVTLATDTDGDGVANVDDIDDDNDGILDTIEQPALVAVYDSTGSDQIVTAPAGAIGMIVQLWGAGGGHEIVGSGYAGAGGYTSAEFGSDIVTPGTQFTLVVGEGGNTDDGRPGELVSQLRSAYGFGSLSGHDQGGGLTGIFLGSAAVSSTDHARALAIAGGGGGYENSGIGTGTNGGNGNSTTSGGEVGTFMGSTDNQGLYAGVISTAHISGGGGGYEGGGRLPAPNPYSNITGGINYETAAAAGGSGFVAASAINSSIQFTADGVSAPPETGDPNYGLDANGKNVGVAGTLASTSGGDGRLVITWIIATDTDGDGIADHLDIDSDDDGITDNIEAQTTAGYIAPSGTGAGITDADGDGLDDNYDANTADVTSATSLGLAPVDTDGDGTADYFDVDSDNDSVNDIDENGLGVAQVAPGDADTDGDGLKDAYETAIDGNINDGFVVNEGVTDPLLAEANNNGYLPDADGDAAAGTPLSADLDYRDEANPPVLDLNSTASLTDPDRDFTSTFQYGEPAVAITDLDADALDGEAVSDFTQLTITPTSALPNGANEILQVAGIDFPLGVNKTVGGVTIPGTSTIVDISYQDGVITVRESSNGIIPNADMDALIRSVTYRNIATNPDDSIQRTFDFQVAQYDPATFVIDFEELTPGTNATAAQIGSDPWWADPSALNGQIQDANNPGPWNQTLADNADGIYLFHQTQGNVPNDQRIVFGASGIDVTPDTDYTVSVDIGRQNTVSAGPFEVLINGVSIGQIDVNSGPVQDWQTLTFNFNSGSDTTVDFQLRNLSTNGTGNDFGIDNITFERDPLILSNVATATVTVIANRPPVAVDDTVAVSEDIPVTGNVLDDNGNGADSDADGDSLSVTGFTIAGDATAYNPGDTAVIPNVGTFTLGANGALTFTPDANYNGPVPVVAYDIEDGAGGSDTATLTLGPVAPVNDPPVATDDADSTDEDTAISVAAGSGGLLDNDSDIDGDTLTITEINGSAYAPGAEIALPSGALLTVNADGSYDYDPNGQFEGLQVGDTATDSFTYQIDDGNGGVDTATVTINIVGLNDAPLATPDDNSGTEAQSLSGNIIAGTVGSGAGAGGADTDVDGDQLFVSALSTGTVGAPVALTYGALTVQSDGSYTFMPNATANALDEGEVVTEQVTYTISDGNGGVAQATLTLTLTGENDAPFPALTIPPATAVDGGAVSIPTFSAFNDPDGEALTFTLAPDAPAWLSIDPFTGLITGTPPADASQGGAGSDGVYTIGVIATDPHGVFATADAILTVANLPPAAVDDAAAVGEDGPLATGNVITDAATGDSDTAPDSDPLEVTAADQGGAAITLGAPFTVAGGGELTLNADGSWTFDPGVAYNGLDDGESAVETITYTVSDGNGGSDTTTLTITVTGVNDAPVARDDGETTSEDAVLSEDVLPDNGAGPDSDPEGDALTVTHVNGTAITSGATIPLPSGALLIMNDDGTYAYDPNGQFEQLQAGDSATDTFTYTIDDGNGETSTATVTIAIAGVNDAPRPVEDAATTPEDTPVVIDVLANDADIDGAIDPASVQIVGTANPGDPLVAPGEGVWSVDPLTGAIVFTPEPDYNGAPAPIQYTVADETGDRSDPATVSVIVTPVNDAPRPVDDAATTPEDTPVVIDVLANDADIDGAIDPASVQIVGTANPGDPLVAPGEGVWSVDPLTGAIVFTPEPDYNGAPAPIQYTVADETGDRSDPATVSVIVTPVNDAPRPVDDAATTPEDTPVVIDVLANDADIDGAIDPASVQIVGTANPGDPLVAPGEGVWSVDPLTGAIVFTPEPDYNGAPAPIQYTVADETGDRSDPATVSVIVTPVNDAPRPVDDSATTPEDTPVVIDVLANDADIDGAIDPASVQIVGTANPGDPLVAPGEGVWSVDPLTGAIVFTPEPDYNGAPAPIQYTVADETGDRSDPATVSVIVTPVNDAPRPVDDAATTPEDTPVVIDVLANDADIDGAIDPASVQIVGTANPGDPLVAPGEGVWSVDPLTGAIVFTPEPDYNGAPAPIQYTVADETGDRSDPATVSVIVTPVNDAPIAVDDVSSADEDSVQAGNTIDDPVSGDSDVDGDPILVTAIDGLPGLVGQPVSLTYGQLTVAADGSWTFIPNAAANALAEGDSATETVSYQISDGYGGTDIATLTIHIEGLNDEPQAQGPIADQSGVDGETIAPLDVSAVFDDLDGDPLTFIAIGLPPGLSIDPDTGEIAGTLTPDASQTGPYTVTITATDPSGQTSATSFDWTVANPAPEAVDNSASTPEDTPALIAVLGNDADPDGDRLSVVGFTDPAHGSLTLNRDGSFTYAPEPGFNGTDTFTYTITDGDGGIATATVRVAVAAVNDDPVAMMLAPQANNDGAAVSLDVSAAFSDPDGDPLTYAATGLPPGLSIDPDTGEIAGTLTPDASQGGPYTVVVTAADPSGETAATRFQWNVANPPPVAGDNVIGTPEDTPITFDVRGNDADPDGDPLTVTAFTNPANGTLTLNPDGSFTYVPNPGFNGADTFTYTIDDGDGGADTATVTIETPPVNDLPVAAPIAPQANDDGAAVSLDVSAAFSDPDGDPLTYAATGLPPGLSIDPDTGEIAGTLTPDASQGGPYTVTVTAVDPSGEMAATSFEWSVANPPPVAGDNVIATPEDTPVTFDVRGNDADPDGDPLTVTAFTNPANGTVSLNPDGALTYTPKPGFNGADTFTYTIDDGDGGTDTATVTIAVGPVNDDPVATAIPVQNSNDGETIAPLDVSGVFSDPDGDALTYTATSLPPGLSIDPATGEIAGTLTPDASQGGPYTVTVTAADPSGETAATRFQWNVANPPPIAVDDVGEAVQGQPVTIDVLVNDHDPDGDPLTVVDAHSPDGEVVINPDGAITFTPGPQAVGVAEIVYTISDGSGGAATATIQLTVDPAPAPAMDIPNAPEEGPAQKDDAPPNKETYVVAAANEAISLNGVNNVYDARSAGGLDPYNLVVVQAVSGVANTNSMNNAMFGEDSLQHAIQTLGQTSFGDTTPLESGGFAVKPFGFDQTVPIGFDGADQRGSVELFSRSDMHRFQLGVINRGSVDGPRIVHVRAAVPGSADLPPWLHVLPSGLIVVDKMGRSGPLTIEIEIHFSNGRTILRDVTVNPATGEILSVSGVETMRSGSNFHERLERLALTPEKRAEKVAALLMR